MKKTLMLLTFIVILVINVIAQAPPAPTTFTTLINNTYVFYIGVFGGSGSSGGMRGTVNPDGTIQQLNTTYLSNNSATTTINICGGNGCSLGSAILNNNFPNPINDGYGYIVYSIDGAIRPYTSPNINKCTVKKWTFNNQSYTAAQTNTQNITHTASFQTHTESDPDFFDKNNHLNGRQVIQMQLQVYDQANSVWRGSNIITIYKDATVVVDPIQGSSSLVLCKSDPSIMLTNTNTHLPTNTNQQLPTDLADGEILTSKWFSPYPAIVSATNNGDVTFPTVNSQSSVSALGNNALVPISHRFTLETTHPGNANIIPVLPALTSTCYSIVSVNVFSAARVSYITNPSYINPQAICSGGAFTKTNIQINSGVSSSSTTNFIQSVQWFKQECNVNGVALAGVAAIDLGTENYTLANNTAGTVTSDCRIDNLQVGTYYYYCIAKNVFGCSVTSPSSGVITVNANPPIPTISTTTVTTFCNGGNVVLTSSANSGNQWYKDGNIISGATNQTYAANTSGSYTVTVTNESNCSATSNPITVIVNELPPVSEITPLEASVCVGSTIQLLSNSTPSGIWSTSNTTTATVDATGLVLGVAAGTATINYTVTNANLCSTKVSRDVIVKALPSAPTISGIPSVCVGSKTQLSGAPNGGTWSSSDGSLATVSNGETAGLVLGVAPTEDVKITYTVIGENGCSNSAKITVKVYELPSTPSITGEHAFCSGGQIALTGSSTGGVWHSSNSAVNIDASGVVTSNSGGTTNITYTVTNANGCKATSQPFSVTATLTPETPTIDGITTVCIGNTTILSGSIAGGTWLLPNPLNNQVASFIVNPNGTLTVTGLQVGIVTVGYKVSNGDCSKITYVTITVNNSCCPETCYWTLNGNSPTSADKYIGTNNATDFVVKTGGSAATNERIRVSGNDGSISLKNLQPVSITGANQYHYVYIDENTGKLYKGSGGQSSRMSNTTSSPSQKEVDDLKLEVEELKTQVKALLEARNYSPCTVAQPGGTLEVVPTPFANNAKAIYSIENFNGEASLQIADLSGKVLKTFSINQAKGQIEIGAIQTSTSTVVFTIVSGGKVVVSKKSIKVTE